MASTTFTSGTPVTKEWLNDVDKITYGTSSPITNNTSFWPDIDSTVKVRRFDGRVFVYDGATFKGNFNGGQGGFVDTSSIGASWAPRDSALFSASKRGLIAVGGFSSNQDQPAGIPSETIGVGGFVIGKQTGKSIWGLYSDVQFEDGTSGYGVEFAVKNKSGVDQTAHPYYAIGGAVGAWFVAGGDATYGGSPNANNNWAIAFGSSYATGKTWNKGIIFFKDSLTGADGTTGTATAIEMAKGHSIVWRNTGGTALTIRSDSTSGANDIYLLSTNSKLRIAGYQEAPILDVQHNANAVNYLTVFNSSSGNGVVIASQGADPNVDIRLLTQGSGVLHFGNWTSNADAPVNGYITIKDESGTTRKLATIA